MYLKRSHFFSILLVWLSTFLACKAYCQKDTIQIQAKVLNHFAKDTKSKIQRFSSQSERRIYKSLYRLVKFERRIKPIVTKLRPDLASNLFSNTSFSFERILQEYEKRIVQMEQTKLIYNQYYDSLKTAVLYLKDIEGVNDTSRKNQNLKITEAKFKELEQKLSQNEAVIELIRKRKNDLSDAVIKLAGKNKYLSKIQREVFYCDASLENYKQIFTKPENLELVVKRALEKIPAFKEFFQSQSSVAGLFGGSGSMNIQNLGFVQTRNSISSAFTGQFGSAAGMASNLKSKIAEAKNLMDKLHNIDSSKKTEGFKNKKPNSQKSKTFGQRLEITPNFQFQNGANSQRIKSGTIGLSMGYKLNDQSIAGFGFTYSGTINLDPKLSINAGGFGFRSFLDWKIKKQLYLTGSFEADYQNQFTTFQQITNKDLQHKALIGLTKNIAVNTKLAKGLKLQLLCNLLPENGTSSKIIYRVGYIL